MRTSTHRDRGSWGHYGASYGRPQAEEKNVIYFCPGCNRKCDVLVTQKNGKVISVTDNNCSIGDGHARFQYETDTRANG